MSTTADILPYMQHWLDSRAGQTQANSDFNAAKTALANARAAIKTRIGAGDTAVQMSALVAAYVAAKEAYVVADLAQRNADATTAGRFERFEQAIDLLVAEQDVPPFTP